MDKYFTDGFTLKRYVEDNSSWSDGEGDWETVDTISGHIRALNANERTDIADLIVSHRFYTKYHDIRYKDKIVKDGKDYKVKLVDNKKINTSNLDFMQVDCEMVL